MDLQDAVCADCVYQISDLESEVEYLASSQTVGEVVVLPSTVPVIGESFCQCDRQEELSPCFSIVSDCLCGEEDQGEEKLMNTVVHNMNTARHTTVVLKPGIIYYLFSIFIL